MSSRIDLVVSVLCIGLLLRLAWIDFQTFRIPNRDVLLLTGLASVLLVPGVTPDGLANLVPGLMLFGLGFAFWLMRAMGAGDAKLFFPLGIIVGWPGMAVFAAALLPFSLLLLAFTRLAARRKTASGRLMTRLGVIGRGRGIPYGVPLALAGGTAVLWRLAQ